MKPKKELVRVVRAPVKEDENGVQTGGEVSLDLTGRKPGRALFRGALRGDVIPDIRTCRKGQAETGADLLRQRIELLRRQCRQILPGEGFCLADIAQCRDEGRTELIRQCIPALVREEDQVFALWVDAADCAGRKGGSCIDKGSLFVDEIPAGQGRTSLDRQIGQRFQEGRIAALIMLEDDDFAGCVESRVKVL